MTKDTKQTIIMIHGFRGTHHGLNFIAQNLPEFNIVIPDLPGFGKGEPIASEHSIENYSKWLKGYISDLDLKEPPILLGHSFGSIIAASYASKYPDTISKLILVNPIAKAALERPKISLTRLGILYSKIGFKLPAKLALKWQSAKLPTVVMTLVNARTKDKTLRRIIHKEHLEHFSTFSNVETLYQAFNASIASSVEKFANSIKTDTLLIAGSDDIISSLNEQEQLQKLFSSADLKVIKDVGHLTHYETPDQVAELVRDFTKSL